MGTTPNGLWYPDDTTTITSLNAILADMQTSADLRIEAVRTELSAAFPIIKVQAGASSNQNIPANTVTNITGNNGWIQAVNTFTTPVPYGSVVGGGSVSAAPITITAAGRYEIGFEVNHSASSSGRSFVNLVFGGTYSDSKRVIWTQDDTGEGYFAVNIPAGSTTVGLQTYYASSSFTTAISGATITVEKVR